MEKPLEKLLDEVMSNPGVTGVVCADDHGLCLGVKGVAKRETAGLIVDIDHVARKLHPESKETPVICIETEAGNVVIKSSDGVTMGIHKVPS